MLRKYLYVDRSLHRAGRRGRFGEAGGQGQRDLTASRRWMHEEGASMSSWSPDRQGLTASHNLTPSRGLVLSSRFRSLIRSVAGRRVCPQVGDWRSVRVLSRWPVGTGDMGMGVLRGSGGSGRRGLTASWRWRHEGGVLRSSWGSGQPGLTANRSRPAGLEGGHVVRASWGLVVSLSLVRMVGRRLSQPADCKPCPDVTV